jgi:outer membrane protein OmpA-like peptidoglycan-associated protein
MPPAAVVPSPDLNALFQGPINDAFFGYDKSDIRPDARAALEKDAEFLNLHHDIRFAIEGAL